MQISDAEARVRFWGGHPNQPLWTIVLDDIVSVFVAIFYLARWLVTGAQPT